MSNSWLISAAVGRNFSVLETAQTTSRIGPHSRRLGIGKIDGRRREAKVMRDFAAELSAHVGTPSAVQRQMIARAAVLHLRLLLMDQQTGPGGAISERNAREYVCWHNAYVRTLRQLGLKGAPERQPSLAEIIAAATPTMLKPLPAPPSGDA